MSDLKEKVFDVNKLLTEELKKDELDNCIFIIFRESDCTFLKLNGSFGPAAADVYDIAAFNYDLVSKKILEHLHCEILKKPDNWIFIPNV